MTQDRKLAKSMKKIRHQKSANNYAFIDSQNLNLGIRSQGWKLDWQKFRLYLRNKYGVKKTYLFIGYVEGNQRLYTFLQEAGYICIFKPTLAIEKGKKTVVKGNVDAELVLHSMIEYSNYEKAVIVSGDGDFYCLIEYLVEQNKLSRVLVPTERYSSLLREFNKQNLIVRVDLMKKSLEHKNKKRGIRGRSKP